MNANRDKLAKKKPVKSNLLSQEMVEDAKTIQQLDQCFQFSKVSFPTWINNLPPEWTVVQISEMWEGHENLGMLGFGPPPLIHNLPKLVIARFHGGHQGTFLTKSLDPPPGSMSGVSLLAELKSILEGNRSVNKDFRGSRDQYWKLKQEQHDQLKVMFLFFFSFQDSSVYFCNTSVHLLFQVLVDSLENWWLDFSKCLLIGELSDPIDLKLLNHTTSAVVDRLRKMKKNITVDEEAWIRLLISCYGTRGDRQFIRGLLKVLNTTARSPLVTELLGYLKTVQPELEKFKNAKRNPVILVLDKVSIMFFLYFVGNIFKISFLFSKVIQQLPWESMPVLSTTPVSRIPSLHFLNSLVIKHNIDQPGKMVKNAISPMTELKLRPNIVQLNPNLVYYIVNPGQDLPGVQLRLQPILEKIWGKQCGLIGAVPVEQHIKESLMKQDIFLYE